MKTESTYDRIYRAVARIPRGFVATYGQVAIVAGVPRGARQVGYALAALTDPSIRIPWHRVINAGGEISLRSGFSFENLQRGLLEREGVQFDAAGRVSLERFQWKPDAKPDPKTKRRAKPAKASPTKAKRRVRTKRAR
jgi:methylated-DNA-protein-cysteine methyltransferase-like protein